jgi:DNA-binding MarR family transcriptional regulator
MNLDSETKALEAPHEHKGELRLWLRLLTCTTLVESQIRKNLLDQFEITLPRFDLLAQLERAPTGMTLGDVSRRMMVTNGNVTGLVERLVASGHVERFSMASDRRMQYVKLSAKGRTSFARMAKVHEDWIAELFAQLSPRDMKDMFRTLGKLKASIKAAGTATKS